MYVFLGMHKTASVENKMHGQTRIGDARTKLTSATFQPYKVYKPIFLSKVGRPNLFVPCVLNIPKIRCQ